MDTPPLLPIPDESTRQLSHSVENQEVSIIDIVDSGESTFGPMQITDLALEDAEDHTSDDTPINNALDEIVQVVTTEERSLLDHDVENIQIESDEHEKDPDGTEADSIISSTAPILSEPVFEISDLALQSVETVQIEQVEATESEQLESQHGDMLGDAVCTGIAIESPTKASLDASTLSNMVEPDNSAPQTTEDILSHDAGNRAQSTKSRDGQLEHEQSTLLLFDISEAFLENKKPNEREEEAIISTVEQSQLPEMPADSTVSFSPTDKMANSPIRNNISILVASSPVSKLVQPVEADPPTPTLEDVTATITLSSLAQLEDDKAILRSFLDRAAASKENKAAMARLDNTNCSRRESLQNRRDSDAIRQALASPRHPLEHKDGNTFSPRKITQFESLGSPMLKKSIDESTDSERILPPIDDLLPKPAGKTSPRRSGRAKSHKTPQSTNAPASDRRQIAVRRNDGNDTINLTKTDAQLAALEMRRNTRKNKGSSLSVQDRLVKWRAELVVHGKDGATPEPKILTEDQKGVRWSQSLHFLNEATGLSEEAPLLDNAQLSKVDPLALTPVPIGDGATESEGAQSARPKRAAKQQTTRIRRMRGLGVSNGTPAKGVLAATLLPDELAESADDNTFTLSQSTERTATLTLSATTTSVVGSNKSRLQPPSKLNLNPSIKSVAPGALDVKEDTKKLVQIKKPVAGAATKKQVSMLPVVGTNKRGSRKLL